MSRLGLLCVAIGTVGVGMALYQLLNGQDFTPTFLFGVVVSALGTIINMRSREVEQ